MQHSLLLLIATIPCRHSDRALTESAADHMPIAGSSHAKAACRTPTGSTWRFRDFECRPPRARPDEAWSGSGAGRVVIHWMGVAGVFTGSVEGESCKPLALHRLFGPEI
jgi:hypothetical protein